jgi:hypothetical protein
MPIAVRGRGAWQVARTHRRSARLTSASSLRSRSVHSQVLCIAAFSCPEIPGRGSRRIWPEAREGERGDVELALGVRPCGVPGPAGPVDIADGRRRGARLRQWPARSGLLYVVRRGPVVRQDRRSALEVPPTLPGSPGTPRWSSRSGRAFSCRTPVVHDPGYALGPGSGRPDRRSQRSVLIGGSTT